MKRQKKTSAGLISEESLKEKKKAAAGIAVAAVTGISLLLGGLFQSPAELAQDMRNRTVAPPAFELVIPNYPDDGDDGDTDEDNEETSSEEEIQPGIFSVIRARILRLPWVIRAFFLIPLWALGTILLIGLSSLWGAVLSPVMGTVLGWVCTAAVILAVILGSVKAAFPEMPVRKILNRKTVSAVIIGVAVFAAADAILPLCKDNYTQIQNAFRICSASLLAIGTAVGKLLKNKPKKTIAPAQV